MKKGEKGILVAIVAFVVLFTVINMYRQSQDKSPDKGIPFYTTASRELQDSGAQLIRDLECRKCHTLWGIRDPMQSVPSPSLDGIGALYDEEWFYDYLSADDPQSIVPSRLKDEYKMPSYSMLPEGERRLLAEYLSHLKVEEWYLPEVRKSEYEKLTGKEYTGGDESADKQ